MSPRGNDALSTLHALCQESWDAGRDPVDDPAVQDFLLAHPEHLEAFADLRERIGMLADLPPTPLRKPRYLARWLPAAAVLLVAFLWWSIAESANVARDTITPGFLSAEFRQEVDRTTVGSIVTRETHESRAGEHGMYAVLRIEHRKPIHPRSR